MLNNCYLHAVVPMYNTHAIYISLNSLRAKFFRGNKNIYLHFIPFLHINMTGSWNPSSWKTRNYLVYVVHIMAADGLATHDDVIKWKHFPRYWPFVRGIYQPLVNSPHKGQWRGALVFSLICVWINGWVNNREAGDLRCYRAHYYVSVMTQWAKSSATMILT